MLEFLEDTRVGWMPGRVFLAGGPDVDESDLDETEVWPPVERESESSGISEEEDGPSSPYKVYFSFIFL